ncbi:hypothetical protein LIER_04936 [Lithospermum erythrorhizon]|uniref:Uncharacterized protein n=1 Tax=Lithospermum erythrorhizon TaxID=34254 RepID=A0AAV3P0H2_LITER
MGDIMAVEEKLNCPSTSSIGTPLPSPLVDGADTPQSPRWESYESVHALLTESEMERMKDMHRSHIMRKLSHHLLQVASTAESLALQESDKEDEADRLEAQRAEAVVKDLTERVADLYAQHRAAGPQLSWQTAGAILSDFVLNYQDQVPNLPTLLAAYK